MNSQDKLENSGTTWNKGRRGLNGMNYYT